MKKDDKDLMNISENDVLEMMNDTSQLLAQFNANELSSAAIAAQGSNALTDNIEFWKWMGRNYSVFDTNQTMQQYISQGIKKEEWVAKQLQGKGYEWDWMSKQRNNIKNTFNTYDAGDIANRAASDVTERSLLTGKTREYQMKAYTSDNSPHLDNTPKDMTVVTNVEKVDGVKLKGYDNVDKFQDSNTINKSTEKRLKQIKEGKAYTSYSIKNVSVTMAKAGTIGCVVGMGTEAIVSYKYYKEGKLTKEEYLKEILKSGGEAGITAGATTGLMIPVSAVITAAGASNVLAIPITFIISNAVNKIVAPCFGRGKYREILSEARYYQNLENVYSDMLNSMENASNQYYDFVMNMALQNKNHEEFKAKSMNINKDLKDLYDSI
ncbi:hypothetical protein [Clostridium sp.]|uniref:hypothetical protein n=1 Tax=Clostridium sp. TaxID=1506 RepID=UPI001B78D384|nr:hypothetical protein [Clostridium sp.]MBP3916489.1 hypothetical protein [Clostridium sp.]